MKTIFIYIFALAAAASSLLLMLWAYSLKCPFELQRRRAFQDKPLASYEGGGLLLQTDTNDFNARLFEHLSAEGVLPDGVALHGAACVFADNSPAGELYINLASDKFFGQVFSFVCQWELALTDNAATVRFSDIRLGAYKIPYLGEFLWRAAELPEQTTFQTDRENGLLYLTSVKTVKDGKITFAYSYDTEALSSLFTDILALSDEIKIDFHTENGTADAKLANLARQKSASPEEALAIVTSFEKSPESFRALTRLLSSEGVSKLCDAFGKSYYRHADAKTLIEASENELDSGLSDFNKRFARLLLRFLYQNPGYTIKDGALYANGAEITPGTVLGTDGSPYEVELSADKKSVRAFYGVSGEVFERVILTD